MRERDRMVSLLIAGGQLTKRLLTFVNVCWRFAPTSRHLLADTVSPPHTAYV